MGFFGNLFRAKRNGVVALIDIGAGTVAGSYVQIAEGVLPTILYTCRLPIEIQNDEPHERAMLRAVEILGTTLVREGIPALVRAHTGESVSEVLVSIDAPWQEISIHVEQISQQTDFIFTRHTVDSVAEKMCPASTEKVICDVSLIATVLNGYDVQNPFGKKVHHASVTLLVSHISKTVSDTIGTTFQKLYHTKHVSLIAGGSVRYQAMHIAFPHETGAIIIDSMGPVAEISLIRKGLLVSVVEVPTDGEGDDHFVRGLSEIAKSYPLPRTIFLITREADAPAVQKKLETTNFGSLWLSGNPPAVIPIRPSHFTGLVRQSTTPVSDVPLLLMALYHTHQTR